jgi:hypothetical protein
MWMPWMCEPESTLEGDARGGEQDPVAWDSPPLPKDVFKGIERRREVRRSAVPLSCILKRSKFVA